MRTDLAVDEFEAVLRIGDLLAQAGGEFGEEVAVCACGGFGVEVEMGDVAREQRVPLGIEDGDIAFGVLDLAGDAEKLGDGAFVGDGGIDLAVIVEHALQGFGIAAAVGLIGASHQQGEVPLLGVVAGEVGMDTLGDIAKESLEAGRRIELFGLGGVTECCIVSLLCLLAGLFGAAASRVGVIERDLALGDAGFEFIKLSVEDTDLAEITALEGFELSAKLGKLGFSLGERRANSGELLALIEEGGGVRSLLEDDFSWHAASHEGKF